MYHSQMNYLIYIMIFAINKDNYSVAWIYYRTYAASVQSEMNAMTAMFFLLYYIKITDNRTQYT
mgnify:CR=1 FL=1